MKRGKPRSNGNRKETETSEIAVAARHGKWQEALQKLSSGELGMLARADARKLAQRYGIKTARANLVIADAKNILTARQAATQQARFNSAQPQQAAA